MLAGTKGSPKFFDLVQASAAKNQLEGFVQAAGNDGVIICAAGDSDSIENLLDTLYSQLNPENVTINPMPAVRDFRGTFRVVLNA